MEWDDDRHAPVVVAPLAPPDEKKQLHQIADGPERERRLAEAESQAIRRSDRGNLMSGEKRHWTDFRTTTPVAHSTRSRAIYRYSMFPRIRSFAQQLTVTRYTSSQVKGLHRSI